mgnify:CR=1 FL=1
MLRARERVAADADAQRLAEPDLGRRVDGLVRERARARDDTCGEGERTGRQRRARAGEGGEGPGKEGAPTEPGVKMLPGMMPILQPPPPGAGAMMPGQLGPTRRDLVCLRSACATCATVTSRVSPSLLHLLAEGEEGTGRRTRTSSCCGMPSVMQTMRGISASMASMMASAANGGGT